MYRVLIISHERSLNKLDPYVSYFSDWAEINLVVDLKVADYKAISKKINIHVIEYFSFEAVYSAVGDCHRVFVLSENLLWLQSRLEERFGIKNISSEAALVLSDKFLFDEYCRSNDLGITVPKSKLVMSISDLDLLGNSLIFKPTVGSGGKPYLMGAESIEYKVFSYTKGGNGSLDFERKVEKVIRLNERGIRNARYIGLDCKVFAQEFIPSRLPSLAPCGYFRDGELRVICYFKNIKIDPSKEGGFDKIDFGALHFSGSPKEFLRDFAVCCVPPEAVDLAEREIIEAGLRKLLESLKVRELFFSGPDFHYSGNKLVAIDFNPRMSSFFSMLDRKFKGRLMKSLLENQPIPRFGFFLWSVLPISGGLIKQLDKILQHLPDYPEEMKSLRNGDRLPDVPFLQSNPTAIQVIIEAEQADEIGDRLDLIANEVKQFIES